MLVATGLALAAPAIGDDADEKLDKVRERMSTMFEAVEPEHINIGPLDGWYEIQSGSIVAYVSAPST